MKPVQRLNRFTIVVLEQYDSDADTAIHIMETTIKGLRNQLETCQSVTKVLQEAQKSVTMTHPSVTKPLQPAEFGKETVTEPLHDQAYWKKLSETVDSCIERAKRY